MKTLKTLSILLLMSLTFISCSKDDDTVVVPTNAELVIGLWKHQSRTQDGNPVALQPCQLLTTVRFATSNMYTETHYTGQNCSTVTPLSGTYTIDEVNITVNNGSVGITARIITLNDTNLSIEFNDSGILTVDNYLKQL